MKGEDSMKDKKIVVKLQAKADTKLTETIKQRSQCRTTHKRQDC